jgi:hypothetical protein
MDFSLSPELHTILTATGPCRQARKNIPSGRDLCNKNSPGPPMQHNMFA